MTDRQRAPDHQPALRPAERALARRIARRDGFCGRRAYDRERTPPLRSARQLIGLFGSWQAVCAAAGVAPHERVVWSWDDCRRALLAAAKDLGPAFTQATYRQWRRTHPRPTPSPERLACEGTWREVLGRVGLRSTRARRWTPDAVAGLLRECQEQFGSASDRPWRAFSAQRRRAGQAVPASQTVLATFGSWEAARQAARLAGPKRAGRKRAGRKRAGAP